MDQESNREQEQSTPLQPDDFHNLSTHNWSVVLKKREKYLDKDTHIRREAS